MRNTGDTGHADSSLRPVPVPADLGNPLPVSCEFCSDIHFAGDRRNPGNPVFASGEKSGQMKTEKPDK